MRPAYPLSALLTVVVFADPANAQQVSEGLSIRLDSSAVRMISGQRRAGFNGSDQLINLRSNVLAEHSRADVDTGFEVFDSRICGDNAGTPITANEVNALEPGQAYIGGDFAEALGPGTKLTLTAGRMTLNLGSRRLRFVGSNL